MKPSGAGIALMIVLLVSCTSCTTTEKPPYSGLLPDGASPTKSSLQLSALKQSSGVIVVLSQSTRDSIKLWQEIIDRGYPYALKAWIADVATPIKTVADRVQVHSDLSKLPPGSWVVVVHWILDMRASKHGASIEYHVFDESLRLVDIVKAQAFDNCDSMTNASHAACYNRVMARMIDEATREFSTRAKSTS